ncbi:MAG: EAL domain-containing protein [Desulfarculus sp.]|nr:EAL domain-containing protein [Desulfarculus sp.]
MLQQGWIVKAGIEDISEDAPLSGKGQGRPLVAKAQRRELEAVLAGGTPLAMVMVRVAGFSLFERLYGATLASRVVEELERVLQQEVGRLSPQGQALVLERLEGASFMALFPNGVHGLSDLFDMALRLRLSVRNKLNHQVMQLTGQSLRIEAGCSLLPAETGRNFESLLHFALDDAHQAARGSLDPSKLGLMHQFRQILEVPLLASVYQPILDLRRGEILGWEALARGPEDSYFSSPQMLFDFAEEVGNIFTLERVCREQALAGLGGVGQGQKLFLNIHPQTLGDPNFRPGQTLSLLERYGLSPHNVVFEITERHPIKDFTLFHRTLEHYRSQGYLVAIDDVGTGYSGLSSLAKVRPDFIKVDMSLIRGIDTNPVQRALLETMVTFANKIGCAIVAEGIETQTELTSIVAMGVHYGQGFHLAKPSSPKPQICLPVSLLSPGQRRGGQELTCSMPVRELVEPALQVLPETPTKNVKRILDSQPIGGVVVALDDRPLGLVMSHSLDRLLGAYYGTSLYWERNVTRVMDPVPLIVEGSLPVEQVAGTAMSRERFKIYDHIIVTDNGRLMGIVSVQKMLDALARVQVEMARGMSPLTGLPGNVALEQEIERLCRQESPVSLIYADLDNFKVYNDSYGFEAGDQIILLMARVMSWALRRHGEPDDFLGHLGGDDMVAITTPERAERVCQAAVRCFKRLVGACYTSEDRRNGFVMGKDRAGKPGRFPLVSVSLAIVDSLGPCQIGDISKRAAEVKRWAKSIPGNVYVRDRRSPLAEGEAMAPEQGA